MKTSKAIGVAMVVGALTGMPAALAKDCMVYFGTYTDTSSKGIYVSRLDLDSGKLSAPELAATITDPSYLGISPNGRFLYAVTEEASFQGTAGGAVSAFALDDRTGMLKLLDEKSSSGADPCYVGLDAAGRVLLVANYSAGSVKSFHVNPDGTLADGTLIAHHGSSVNRNRQSSAHAHSFVAAPGGRFALACDLGMDKVMIYKVNPADGTLTPNEPAFGTLAPGSGPRHLAFGPDGKSVYVLSEMACTATAFAWDGANGKLDARQTVLLLPPDMPVAASYTAAEIGVRPDGRFVYATVRGPDVVSVLAVDKKSGNLSLVETLPCGGKMPRGMGIDPSGHWLIVGNQRTGTVTSFGIDAATGRLTPTGQVLSVGSAVDVKFAPVR
ncbi:MAG: lactonase family protein [Verrucomicrobiota bacterium]|jgi:6-phosphogluconolactonase